MKNISLLPVPATLGIVLLIAGCTPAPYIALKQDNAPKIATSRVYAVVAQDGLNAAIDQSHIATYTLGGLIPALIDASIDKSRMGTANKLIEPLRQELSDFDFRAKFADDLQKTLPVLPNLKIAKFEASAKPLDDKGIDDIRKQLSEDAFILVSAAYELSADFQSLEIVTNTTIWLKTQADPVYLAEYYYQAPPTVAAGKREDAVKAWSDNNAAALRSALTDGVAQTMKLFQLDLKTPLTPMNTPDPLPKFYGPLPSDPLPSAYTFYAKDGDRYTIRYNRVLYSVPEKTAAPKT